jgi:hypothetical protein
MLQLKNVKFSEWNSEETNCFQAVVYLNGKRVGLAYNEGHGGATDVDPIDSDFESYKKLRAYCQAQADANKEEYYETYTIIDLLFEDWLREHYAKKEKARQSRDFEKGICYSKPDKPDSYYILSFMKGNKPTTISEVQKSFQGKATLTANCKKLVAEGCKVLNTNLSFTF